MKVELFRLWPGTESTYLLGHLRSMTEKVLIGVSEKTWPRHLWMGEFLPTWRWWGWGWGWLL